MRTVLALAVLAGATLADEASIRWHVPHEFDAARERARTESRILVIKGVSFGIDEEGAVCATKGKW
jgi:hypothetical protein